MEKHVTLLGLVHIVIGLGGLAALLGVALLGGAAWLVATLGGFSAGLWHGLAASGVAGGLLALALGVAAVGCVPALAAGWGLLKRRPWAPMLALVLAVFNLFAFPLGTAFAVYTGWVLLSEEGQRACRLASGRPALTTRRS